MAYDKQTGATEYEAYLCSDTGQLSCHANINTIAMHAKQEFRLWSISAHLFLIIQDFVMHFIQSHSIALCEWIGFVVLMYTQYQCNKRLLEISGLQLSVQERNKVKYNPGWGSHRGRP